MNKATIALVIITIVSFSVFFGAASAVEKKDGEDSLVERVVSRYGEKLPQKEIVRLGEGTLASDIDTLIIESKSESITFYPEEKEGKVEVFGALETTTSEIKKEGSKLIVNVETKSGMNWNFKVDKENIPNSGIRVYLPKTVKHLQLKTTSGDIKISPTVVESFSIVTTSGDITADNVVTNTSSVTSSSGNIKLDITTGMQSITTSSGDVSLNARSCRELIARSSSGDINVTQNCQYSEITTSSGDVKIHEKIPAVTTTIRSSSGDVDILYTQPLPSVKVLFTSSSGSLRASELESQITNKTDAHHFNINAGEHALNVITSSGDLTLSLRKD